MVDLIVAVLTGGASRRMGTDKAALRVAGRSMADWVVSAAAPLGEVVRVGGPGASVEDAPGSGPLSGLAAVLDRTADGVLLLATDHPWVRTETLIRLTERFDGAAVVPLAEGTRQVTCAIYPTAAAERAKRLARDNRGLQELLDAGAVLEVTESTWRGWGEDGRSWFSVDTPDDLEMGLERYGEPGS